jgi:hypothetical protein
MSLGSKSTLRSEVHPVHCDSGWQRELSAHSFSRRKDNKRRRARDEATATPTKRRFIAEAAKNFIHQVGSLSQSHRRRCPAACASSLSMAALSHLWHPKIHLRSCRTEIRFLELSPSRLQLWELCRWQRICSSTVTASSCKEMRYM